MQQIRDLLERAAGKPLPDWDVLRSSYQLRQFSKG